jgi:hypothetical protein
MSLDNYERDIQLSQIAKAVQDQVKATEEQAKAARSVQKTLWWIAFWLFLILMTHK